MKKSLSFLLAAIMFLCFFTGCEEKHTDPKKELFEVLYQQGKAVALTVSFKTKETENGESKNSSGSFDMAYNSSAFSFVFDETEDDASQTGALYADQEAVYIGTMGLTLKMGFKDLEEYLPALFEEEDSEYAEKFEKAMEKLKEFFSEEKISAMLKASVGIYEASVSECSVTEDGDDLIYTVVFDSAKLSELNAQMVNVFYGEFKEILLGFIPENDENEYLDEFEELLKDLEQEVTYDSCSAIITLRDGKLKYVTCYTSSTKPSQDIENETVTVKGEEVIEITAWDEAVEVDDSLTVNAIDLFEQLRKSENHVDDGIAIGEDDIGDSDGYEHSGDYLTGQI